MMKDASSKDYDLEASVVTPQPRRRRLGREEFRRRRRTERSERRTRDRLFAQFQARRRQPVTPNEIGLHAAWNRLIDPLPDTYRISGEREQKQPEPGYKWDRETKELLASAWIDHEAIRSAQRAVNEFLANGGKIKRLPAKKRAIIYGEKGANYVDALRQRAKRGKKAEGTLADIMAGRTSLGLMTEQESKEKSKKEAKEELEWFGCRALPRPYAPIKELACDAHSIRSNIPWDFEDRFLDSLKTPDGRLWGDVFFEAYDHDHMELDPGDAGYKPSATVNDLVRPDFTSSLDRMFGAEVDEKSLKCDSLRGAPKRVQKASKAFDPIWNAVLSELRLEEAKNRGDWHDLLKCPS